MNQKIPNYKECCAIVEKSEAFYKKEFVIEGQKVVIFDYRLASISDFVDNSAFELRGLTFVKDSKGKWNRHILLNKFFNVGETTIDDFYDIVDGKKILIEKRGWLYEDLKNKKIVSVQEKCDGSIISFIPFSNGKIRAKSKTSFTSDQAKMAQELFDKDENLQEFVKSCFNYGITPIFELVGYENNIVVNYSIDKELILLQLRWNETGVYFNKDEVKEFTKGYKGKIAETFEDVKDLDYWLEQKEYNKEDIEGWILTFENGQKAKVKTQLYYEKHQLIGPDAFRHNLLIQSVLNGNIDDIIANLIEGSEKKIMVIEISKKVTKFFNKEMNRIIELLTQNDLPRKEFAIKYNKEYSFSIMMRYFDSEINEKKIEDSLKELIIKKTSSLEKAKEWIKGLQK